MVGDKNQVGSQQDAHLSFPYSPHDQSHTTAGHPIQVTMVACCLSGLHTQVTSESFIALWPL